MATKCDRNMYNDYAGLYYNKFVYLYIRIYYIIVLMRHQCTVIKYFNLTFSIFVSLFHNDYEVYTHERDTMTCTIRNVA